MNIDMNLKFYLITFILLFPVTQIHTNTSENRQALADIFDSNGLTPLHRAIMAGSVSEVKKLLKKGANTERTDVFGVCPLHFAIFYGHVEIVQLLLEYGANVEASFELDQSTVLIITADKGCVDVTQALLARKINIDGSNAGRLTMPWYAKYHKFEEVAFLLGDEEVKFDKREPSSLFTPLHQAVALNNVSIVEKLLAYGAHVNVKIDRDMMPLHIALVLKNSEIIKMLILHNADVYTPMDNGVTSLHLAALGNLAEIVKMLIDRNVDVNAKITHFPLSALHIAVSLSNVEIIRELLTHKADVNVLIKDGWTLLHEAVFCCCSEDIISMLLEYGANIDARDKKGNTPLHDAVSNKSKEVVSILLKYGACTNIQDLNGKTPLHLAVSLENFTEIIPVLLEYGANIDAQDNKGNTSLHYASFCKCYEVIELLLKHNADSSIKNKNNKTVFDYPVDNGFTLLGRAVEMKDYQRIARLLAEGCDINDQNIITGDTLLHKLSRFGSIEMVKFLISKNANVNAVNFSGNTPLQIACFGRGISSIETISALIAAGADVNALNSDNRTVLDIAYLINPTQEIIDLLKKYGARSAI